VGYCFDPIAVVHSPFKEKFGIPRQAGLMADARATLEILTPYDREEAFRGLAQFTHVWLVFVFHAGPRRRWRPTVRPPRLGGNRRIGVFATRSGFRPNPIGLSAVRLDGISHPAGGCRLHVAGIDLLDGTPVLDIKPYLPYADAIADAGGGFAPERPAADLAVVFSPRARAACRAREDDVPGLGGFIEEMLRADPRPAYHARTAERKRFGTRVFDVDVQWEIEGGRILVTDLKG
jgi:tRNA-Thr(GGU) m(6)t(6)A37 methyltransferase TsaA